MVLHLKSFVKLLKSITLNIYAEGFCKYESTLINNNLRKSSYILINKPNNFGNFLLCENYFAGYFSIINIGLSCFFALPCLKKKKKLKINEHFLIIIPIYDIHVSLDILVKFPIIIKCGKTNTGVIDLP